MSTHVSRGNPKASLPNKGRATPKKSTRVIGGKSKASSPSKKSATPKKNTQVIGGKSKASSSGNGGILPKPPPVAEKLKLDAGMRLMLELLDGGDWQELAWRTGLIVSPGNKGALPLPILLTFEFKNNELQTLGVVGIELELSKLGVRIVSGWFEELARNNALLRMPGVLLIDGVQPAFMPDGERVEDRLGKILALGFVTRIALSGYHLPLLEQSLGDIGMPANSTFKGKKLSGKGIVVGIIDDGCPFAHQDFLTRTGTATAPVFHARTSRLWDQAAPPPTLADVARGWKAGALGGREITAAAIDTAINAPTAPIKPHITPQGWVDEDAVYDYFSYPARRGGKLASHGSRVMGIASSNGRSATGFPGVAPEAEVVFVQLPELLIDFNPAALTTPILDGINYIFNYATSVGKAAVVNISYGGYSYAHDGSSFGEVTIDQLLALPDRCVVVSAGNGFEADCHTSGTVRPFKPETREWWINAEDPTRNDIEIWYPPDPNLQVSLVAPDGTVYGPYALHKAKPFKRPGDGWVIGWIDHETRANGDNSAEVWLRPTGDPPPGFPVPTPSPGMALAPAGMWTIQLDNVGPQPIDFHAWIRRDDTGPAGRRQQSRFAPEQADSRVTIGDLASGRRTISVGAHNVATQEVGRYSAAGPTRPTGGLVGRSKPDVCAPAEEVPHGGGVLSTASARAQHTRIGGTSAAAPHVAGIVALIFEYAKYKGVSLTAAQIRAALRASASPVGLVSNRRQRAARYPKIKQDTVWNDVVGKGKVNLEGALRYLFPP